MSPPRAESPVAAEERDSDATKAMGAWTEDEAITTTPPTKGLSSVFDPFARARAARAADESVAASSPSALEISRSAIKQRSKVKNAAKHVMEATIVMREAQVATRPATMLGARRTVAATRTVTADAGSRRRLLPLQSPVHK